MTGNAAEAAEVAEHRRMQAELLIRILVVVLVAGVLLFSLGMAYLVNQTRELSRDALDDTSYAVEQNKAIVQLTKEIKTISKANQQQSVANTQILAELQQQALTARQASKLTQSCYVAGNRCYEALNDIRIALAVCTDRDGHLNSEQMLICLREETTP